MGGFRSGGTEGEAGRWPLDERPGFLLRRAHQIHVGLFAEACARFAVTPLQFSLLSALIDRETADQTELANIVALDRTTTTGALKRLERRGLLKRERSRTDRRAYDCALTEAGRELHQAMSEPVRQAHDATLGPLSEAERDIFLRLLRRVAGWPGR